MTTADQTPVTAVEPPPSGYADRHLLAQPSRQSLIALAFIAWRFLRRVGLANLGLAAVFLVNGTLPLRLWLVAVVGALALLVASILNWWRFTFFVDADELVVTKGVLSVERLVIPLDRVQGVSIDQRLLHRVVGLVSASVDTAGTSGPEFTIDAIERSRAEALRRLAADARVEAPEVAGPGSPPGPPPADHVVIRRTARDLVGVGATRAPWAGLVVLAPLFAFSDRIEQVIDVDSIVDQAVDRGTQLGGGSIGVIVLLAVVAVVGVTVIGTALQVVREILTNWDLTLYRTASGLRRTAGLLNTTSRSSTVRRIQMVTTEENPLQRRLGFTRLTLRAVGANDLVLPGTRWDEASGIRELVFPAVGIPVLDRRISRLYVYRAVRNAAILAIGVTAALWVQLGAWGLVAWLFVPVQLLTARRQWRLRRWGLSEEHIMESYELVTRHTAEVPLFKAQMVQVTRSLFERRRGLASVRIDTADGYLAIPLIEHAEAMAVRDRVLAVAETDRRAFM